MDKKERTKQYYIKNKAIILERNKLCNAKREDKNRKEYYKNYYIKIRKPKNRLNKKTTKKNKVMKYTNETREEYINRRREEIKLHGAIVCFS